MAQESVTDYLDQIFRNRRYCSECGAMTPILSNEDFLSAHKYASQRAAKFDMCECCLKVYDLMPLRKMKIVETYGLAIVHEDALKKMIKCTKSL